MNKGDTAPDFELPDQDGRPTVRSTQKVNPQEDDRVVLDALGAAA